MAHDEAALERLRTSRGFVFDLDGTLVLGDRRNLGLKPLPGAIELIGHLGNRGVPFVCMTNGTVRTPEQYVVKLAGLGFAVRNGSVMTPASVAADYLARHRLQRVMVLGCEGVSQPLVDAGLSVIRPDASEPVEAIFIGWHRDFTMDELESACHAVWQGARVFTSSLAPFFATADGKALGTSRAISAMITSITGRRAKVLGKPSLEALRSAGRRLGLRTTELAVVGDDPELEIPMAHKGGALAIGVHSGVGKHKDFAELPPERQPHLSVRSVDELLSLYLA